MDAIRKTEVMHEALAGCEGFGVYGPSACIGTVEAVQPDTRSGRPALLSVRAGLLGSWLVHVPVDQVQDVSRAERRIRLRSGGLLAGPRKPGARTPAG